MGNPCSFQRWPLRTDHFLLTFLAQSCPPTCHSYSHLYRREKCWEDRVNIGVLQQGFGICQAGFTCVTSLALTLTQCGTAILQMGTLRHRAMNSPKVAQLGGIKLGFRPRQSGSKGCALNHHATRCLLTCLTYLSTAIFHLFLSQPRNQPWHTTY